MKKYILIFSAITSSSIVYASDTDSTIQQPEQLETVIVNSNSMLGNKYLSKLKSGSAYYLSPEEIKQYNYADINRMLGKVPGVNAYEEDGYGLRPNISLRGTSPERTSKITIMEDGVLAAPAPYSAPAAYYFPNAQRMTAIEILKGSSQIQYGPFTTGGAINLLSTPITRQRLAGGIRANYGNFNTFNIHAHVSQQLGQISYLVEGLKYNSGGFKSLENNNQANTGFDRNEIIGKLKIVSKPNATYFQSLELKMAYNNESANETYLGLTANDYNTNPYMRYAGSQYDNIRTRHQQVMATHTIDFNPMMRLTTTVYHNGFARNWYKLDGVRINNSKIALGNILNNPDNYPEAYAILRGGLSADNALDMKHNNRKYGATGIQTKYDYHFTTHNNVHHDIEIGLRYHTDYEDRMQMVDGYRMDKSTMISTSEGKLGTDANRVTAAAAVSAFAMYKLTVRGLSIVPGVRVEHINYAQKDYGKNDSERTGTDLKKKSNTITAIIPGISATYKINDDWNVFAGVHKGFAPSGVDSQQLPESSMNTEIGTRYTHKAWYLEGVLYHNQYTNLLGSDLAATGGSGTLDLFNAGKVSVQGVEVIANYNVLHNHSKHYRMPVELSYTYTSAIFQNDFKSNEGIWGEVHKGDEMPYIPKHQLYIGVGLEHDRFAIRMNTRYNSGFRTIAGTGAINPANAVPSYMVTDMSGKYFLTDKIALTANVNNLFNNKYIVSLVPFGLRPGMPLNALVGVDIKL